ncbi:MAG: zinc ribbon domain-containing protein [Firmicutes bacterium]|nr:zinc ribbon domain-containing protein [Bacillota bacterium]
MAELFDKVKQGVEKGISSVSVKSKEVIESRRINRQIETFREEIKRATGELGQMVYAMYAENNFAQEPIREKCAAIAGIHGQIAEKEAELERLRLETGEALGKIYCPQCKVELAEGFKFCSQCGAKVTEQPAES